ncbi:hybrid sensor histidine kinase/response regulator [Dyella sp. GSA-30]|uniref:hybrid sensor histidine kinase/response regulator n=1 Tax=Dyella sp. GSA-30 TaxID=2994496 RepID=UPI0024936BAC|nr:hybrid sensor histidine kinase/response regulator [Dyella sp. GSA-30]BDU20265.1 histidine kinase [Dyella sp. GSA-30]
MIFQWFIGVVLTVLLAAQAVWAQPPAPGSTKFAEPRPTPQFRHFDKADGLAGSAINTVAQDATGYMWFGGSAGLTRYDGVDFATFRHQHSDASTLASDEVTRLAPMSDGRLWVATANSGVDRYDPRHHRFEHWRHSDDPGSLSDDSVLALALAPDESLWVGTKAGLDRLLPDGSRFEHIAFPHGDQPDDRTVSALMAQPDGTLWIGTRSGKLLKRTPRESWQSIDVPYESSDSNEIHRIQGDQGDIRISTRQGLFLVGSDDQARPAFSHTQLPASFYVFGSARDWKGRLWLATIHGLVMEDERSRIHRFHAKPTVIAGLPFEWVLSVTSDREGGLWFTSYEGGVAYLPPGWEGFSRYTHIPDDPSSLPDNPPSVVAPSADGKLWVGSYGRIDKFDPTTGKTERVIGDLQHNVIHIIDSGDALWFTVRGELRRFKDGKVEQIDPERRWITRPELLARGDDGTIFLTVARHGVVRIDPDSKKISAVPMAPDIQNVDLQPGLLAVHGGRLWYGNHEGLLRWSLHQDRMNWVPGVERGKPVTALTFDGQGFWLARVGRLQRYRWDGDRATSLVNLTAQDGWRDSAITDLDVDSSNVLWIFSESGLWSFDAQNGALQRFGAKTGLMEGTVGPGAVNVAVTQNTEPLYVPTRRGVIGFRPGHAAHLPASPPPLIFTQLHVEGSRGQRDLIPENGGATIQWFDRALHVQARMLSYVDAGGIRYRFRLSDFDDEWVDTGKHGSRDISGLAPGMYRLDAAAFDASGAFLQQASIWLHVELPPWGRWWAWCSYLVLALSMAWVVFRVLQQRAAERHEILFSEQRRVLAEQSNAAKTQFLATLGHEIRTPMTGVLGMAELLLHTPLTPLQNEYAKAMRRSGALLLKLVNDALDLARIETGRLELESVPFDVEDLIDDVVQLERPQAEKKGLTFEIEVIGSMPSHVLGDAVRIKQILLNLINNALKFTEAGKVVLRVERVDDGLAFTVIDTGPGVPPESQERIFERFEQGLSPERRNGSGLGLAICRELVASMGGTLSLQSSTVMGSRFQVHLPLPEADKAASSSSSDKPTADSSALRLLLVEDDLIVAAVVRGLLEHQGHTVRHVLNGLAVLVELEQERYDAILLDLDLPGLSGFEIARMVRKREGAGPHIPMIAVTARSAADDEQRVRLAGMDGFLRKPLSGRELNKMLAEVVERKSAMLST